MIFSYAMTHVALLQLQIQQVMTLQIGSHTKYLTQTYNILVLSLF